MSNIEEQFEAIASEYIHVEDDPLMSAYELNVNWPNLKTLMSDPPQKVLDYGAGGGTYSRIMAEMGYEVLAVDNAESMIQETETKGLRSKKWSYTDGLLGETFNIILAKLVVQFVDDLDSFAKVMCSHLAERGKVIISIPHPNRSRPQLKAEERIYKTQVGQSGLFVDMIHREKSEIVKVFEEHKLRLVAHEEPLDLSNDESPKRLNLVFEKAQ